jgi:cell division septation protein DedD
MVLDYQERRQVSKNRPKKQGGGLLVTVAVGSLATTFALGFASGWYVGKSARKPAPTERPAPAEGGRKDGAAPAALQPAATGTAGGLEPSLTFYNTLPKGGKAVIGSGLNPAKGEERGGESRHATSPAAPAPHLAPAAAAAPAKPEEAAGKSEGTTPKGAPPPAPAPEKKVTGDKGKFTVQAASCREKREAEALRDRLVAKGVAAYIMESHVQDKGVWYRVRAGKGLSQQEAKELAAKFGKEALVIPE